ELIFSPFWPEVLQETAKVAEKCHLSLDFTKRKLPTYPVPNNLDAHEYLEQLCWRQVKRTYEHVTKEISDRLTYELDIIQTMGFSDYFLIVRSEEHTSELQSRFDLVCRLLLEQINRPK